MFDFYYAVTHHLELVQVSQAGRVARSSRTSRPGLKNYFYLRLGDYLISLGCRLREASDLQPESPALQKVFPELAQEYP